MASIFGKFLTILGLKRREANILVVGLDNSGKSTILNYLKRKEDRVEEIVPTVGFTVERLSGLDRHKANLAVTAFDMSGQGRYRNLWEHYYANVEAIIFVVDSTDALRLVVARDELEMMLKHHKVSSNLTGGATATAAAAGNGEANDEASETGTLPMSDVPLLFFANKMDLKDALPSVQISNLLGLSKLPHKQWHIQASNAITGEGIQEGIEWLLQQMSLNKKTSSAGASKILVSGSVERRTSGEQLENGVPPPTKTK